MNDRTATASTRFPRTLWVAAGTTAGLAGWWLANFDLIYPQRFLLMGASITLLFALLLCIYSRLPRPEITATFMGYYAGVQAFVFGFFSLLAIVDSVRPVSVSLQLAWQSFALSLAALLLAGLVLASGAGHRPQILAMAAPVLALAPLVILVMVLRLVLYFLMQAAL